MSRNFVKILIGIWLAIALVLTVFLVYNISHNRSAGEVFRIFNWDDNSILTVQKDESIPIDNSSRISIDFSSADIAVQNTDEPNLRIVEKSTGKIKEEEKFTVSKEDNTVRIHRKNDNHLGFIFNMGNFQHRIEVYIPKGYTKDLDIRSSSGNIDFASDMKLGIVNCVASSGDLKLQGTMTTNTINLKASSGNIDVENADAKNYKIETSSGDIKINSMSGSGDVSASSGNVKVRYDNIDDYSNVSAHSGDISVIVPQNISFQFNGKCTSGDINSNFDLNYKNKKGNEASTEVGSAPYKKLNINTNSGDINISK